MSNTMSTETPLWGNFPDQAYQELRIENWPELVAYTFDHSFLKIVKYRHHFKKEREALPGPIQVYLDGVYEGRYPYLDRKVFLTRLNNRDNRYTGDLDRLLSLLPEQQRQLLIDLALKETSAPITNEMMLTHDGSGMRLYVYYSKSEEDLERGYQTIRRQIEEKRTNLAQGKLIGVAGGAFPYTTFIGRLWLAYCWAVVLNWAKPIPRLGSRS